VRVPRGEFQKLVEQLQRESKPYPDASAATMDCEYGLMNADFADPATVLSPGSIPMAIFQTSPEEALASSYRASSRHALW
jgi:hypothetical protein